MNDVEKKLLEIISESLDVDVSLISLETKKDDLPEWDSLGHIKIIMGIEEFFDIKINFNDFEKITSVKHLYNIIKESK